MPEAKAIRAEASLEHVEHRFGEGDGADSSGSTGDFQARRRVWGRGPLTLAGQQCYTRRVRASMPTICFVVAVLASACAPSSARGSKAMGAARFELHITEWTEWSKTSGHRGVPQTLDVSLSGFVHTSGDHTALDIGEARVELGPAALPWSAQLGDELRGTRVNIERSSGRVDVRVDGLRAEGLAFLRGDLSLVVASMCRGSAQQEAAVELGLANASPAKPAPRTLRRPGGDVACRLAGKQRCGVALVEGEGSWADPSSGVEVSARWNGWERHPRHGGLASASALRYFVDVRHVGPGDKPAVTEAKTVLARWTLTPP